MKALDNRFYVKFMQLEIGLLVLRASFSYDFQALNVHFAAIPITTFSLPNKLSKRMCL